MNTQIGIGIIVLLAVVVVGVLLADWLKKRITA